MVGDLNSQFQNKLPPPTPLFSVGVGGGWKEQIQNYVYDSTLNNDRPFECHSC